MCAMRLPRPIRNLLPLLALTLLAASPAAAQEPSSEPLAGPPGDSLNKVLVIGTDGTRWDLLEAAMRSGKAPNLAQLRRQGFGRVAPLQYAPQVFVLSEVGWSSIATGVWPDKHTVDGSKFNMDPRQATKNGYLDFLTRIERGRPPTSTFIASDWANIALALNGGPIFGNAMDARFALDTDTETIEAWAAGDDAVTAASARYLRRGDPDAGFVYLGLVDETAHLAGSATPTYADAIASMDRRVGRLLGAIRSRPSYPFESWTVLVTTDHGQQPWDYPSVVSHLTHTPLQLNSFVLGAGPGLRRSIRSPRVVDIAPTVLHQLGLRVRPGWKLDGRSLSRAKPPSYALARVSPRRGGRRLLLRLALGAAPRATSAVVRLPAGLRLVGGPGALRARVNGRLAKARKAGARAAVVRIGGRRLRGLSLVTRRGGLQVGRRVGGDIRVVLGARAHRLGSLTVPLQRGYRR
jgi:hypothetical protein